MTGSTRTSTLAKAVALCLLCVLGIGAIAFWIQTSYNIPIKVAGVIVVLEFLRKGIFFTLKRRHVTVAVAMIALIWFILIVAAGIMQYWLLPHVEKEVLWCYDVLIIMGISFLFSAMLTVIIFNRTTKNHELSRMPQNVKRKTMGSYILLWGAGASGAQLCLELKFGWLLFPLKNWDKGTQQICIAAAGAFALLALFSFSESIKIHMKYVAYKKYAGNPALMKILRTYRNDSIWVTPETYNAIVKYLLEIGVLQFWTFDSNRDIAKQTQTPLHINDEDYAGLTGLPIGERLPAEGLSILASPLLK